MSNDALNWEVWGMVISIMAFLVGIVGATLAVTYKVGKPILQTYENLNRQLSELANTVKSFSQSCEWIQCKNADEHDEINERLDEHEDAINQHEKSIWELRSKIKE